MAFIKDLFKITKGKKEEETEVLVGSFQRYIQIEDLRHNENLKNCIPNIKSVYVKKSDLIIAWDGANAGTVGVGLEGVIGSTLARLELKNNKVNPCYAARFLQSKFQYLRDNCTGATIPHISKTVLENILIPLPPLETQKKIVDVLDKAQGLINARKEQISLMDELIQSVFYEMFGDPVKNPKGWEVRNVEKVCTNIMGGGTPSKSNFDFYVGDIPWVTPKDMKLDFISDSMDHINEDAINNSSAKLIPENSVLMVIRSGILKRKLPVAINKRCVAVNQDMKAFIINKNLTNSEFFMYFWKSCENYILSKVRAVTADNIEFRQIKEMQYILPPYELQKEFSEKAQQIQANKILMEMSLYELENNLCALMQSAFVGSLFHDLVVGK